ncbi:protein serine/threonine kinase, putative [Entamoeba invadens IP1]|uniref:Protein serine/threonine kinase, putative n=1 Tax=Entamoeba invadens IP1 TaxID=370355 RepID=A0A0A1UDY2_ENTIV|nr:protein serine/threonine kinase, putative [Entamoeba invadens IP1]ELP91000.1 protein serine/threonine kinase, putative [Entamoeba invadens IP1]|eukprot:XP_004257771.1 protein serine/threonine kinase, putative [Entamoeba invadens IP1]
MCITLVKTLLLFSPILTFAGRSTWCENDGIIKPINTQLARCNDHPSWMFDYSISNNNEKSIFTFTKDATVEQIKVFEDYEETNVLYCQNKSFLFGVGLPQFSKLVLHIMKIETRFEVAEKQRTENAFTLYVGCFNNENKCRKEVNDKNRPPIEATIKPLILYSDIDQKWWINTMRINTAKVQYLYIAGYVKQSPNFAFSQYNGGTTFNTSDYLFTGYSSEDQITFRNINNGTLKAKCVCERNTIGRYMYYKFKSTNGDNYTNCNCIIEMFNATGEDVYNFPDCNYNSSLFDLNLTNLSVENEVVQLDFSDWYSLVLNDQMQYILTTKSGNNNKKLHFTTLEIKNENTVIFEKKCKIENLIISSISNFWFKKGLGVTSVTITDNTLKDQILFTVDEVLEDYSKQLTKCGRRAVYNLNKNFLCQCNYTADGFEPAGVTNINKGDCLNNSLHNDLTLQIETALYQMKEDEKWDQIIINKELTLNNNFQLITTNCILNANLVLEQKFTSTNNFQIKNSVLVDVKYNGNLIIGNLIVDIARNNQNTNSVISVFSGGKISSSAQYITIQVMQYPNDIKCFEVISLEDEDTNFRSLFTISESIKVLGNKLMRVCKSGFNDENVICVLHEEDMSKYTSYGNVVHCPLSTPHTTILVESLAVIQNVIFEGKFVQHNDEVNFTKTVNSISDFNNTKDVVIYVSDNSIQNQTLTYTDSFNKLVFGHQNTFTYDKESGNITYGTSFFCDTLLINSTTSLCLKCSSSYLVDNQCQIFDDKCVLGTNKTICESCPKRYEATKITCKSCNIKKCQRCVDSKCILCDKSYYSYEGNCKEITLESVALYEREYLILCKETYFSTQTQCLQCPRNCVKCTNSTICETCNSKSLLQNGICQQNDGIMLSNTNNILFCATDCYQEENVCKFCSMKYTDLCLECNSTDCLKCLHSILNTNGECVNDIQSSCKESESSTFCSQCQYPTQYINSEGICVSNDNCEYSSKSNKCILCSTQYLLNENYTCESYVNFTSVFNCEIINSDKNICHRCLKGFYLSNGICKKCADNCDDCYNLTLCLTCSNNYILSNKMCVLSSSIDTHCIKQITGMTKCAICNTSYFRSNEGTCESCINNCTDCNQMNKCLKCQDNYFLSFDSTKCNSYDLLTNCISKSPSGCTTCSTGYFVKNQYCSLCSENTENCTSCDSNGICNSCDDNFVLTSSRCTSINFIKQCISVQNSKCVKCSFWHVPNSTQTACVKEVVWWLILIIVIVFLIILITILMITGISLKCVLERRRIKKIQEKLCVFDISRSNVKFFKTSAPKIVVNKTEILFGNENSESNILVGRESRELLCVGNVSKHVVKVQFSVKSGCFKYSIRSVPQLFTIPKGKAVEFELFLTPNCSTQIEDNIILFSKNMKKGKTSEIDIKIKAVTEISSRLDPDEITEEKKIGEGSFGVVYKGTFRGNQVAIKKLKETGQSKNALDEFEKEVLMLDKFRSEFIVKFYGAVFVVSKICFVTEFAEFGSLGDLINDCKNDKFETFRNAQQKLFKNMQIKFLIDGAKGIFYLHENGILHRDIKPDNLLIFSIESGVESNAKLTDFGASRNINMLMTNMTFTKGVGTPKYMAPEVLNKEKYKTPSDVYSFAITMYECFAWKRAFSKKSFKYAWDIADFVTTGKRLERPDYISVDRYNLIDLCWKHKENERPLMNEVVEKLNELYEKENCH